MFQGLKRAVEVQPIGKSESGKTLIRIWQTCGVGQSKQSVGWKLLSLDGSSDLAIVDEASEAPRNGYKTGDRAMAEIVAEL